MTVPPVDTLTASTPTPDQPPPSAAGFLQPYPIVPAASVGETVAPLTPALKESSLANIWRQPWAM